MLENESDKNLLKSVESLKSLKHGDRKKIPFSPYIYKGFILLVVFVSVYLIYAFAPEYAKKNFSENKFAYLGLAIYILAMMALFVTFLRKFWSSYLSDIRTLMLLGFLTVFTILMNEIMFSLSPFFLFLPAFAMLIKIFTNSQISLVLTVILALSSYTFNNTDSIIFTVDLSAGIISIFSLAKFQQRMDIAKAGILISIVNVVMILSLDLIRTEKLFTNISVEMLWGLGSGIFCAIVAIGSLSYLETLFGLVTNFKLFDLGNPSHPLLKNLMMNAPGTYQHSIVVGNLAEAAAEAVNADALLTKIGAMYHDIGKMKRPYFFIENQLNENQHSKISPRLSALVIIGHVKEGIELAEENKIPSVIADFIPMHHGTMLVSYFFHQAKQMEENPEDVLEEDFRYPGPKPQTKETAILMLADATEAAVRSISKPTVEQIQKTINKIIKARLDDGQLAESPLTLVDLEKISLSFLRILQSLYHSRIEYPSEEKIMKSLGKNKLQNGNLPK